MERKRERERRVFQERIKRVLSLKSNLALACERSIRKCINKDNQDAVTHIRESKMRWTLSERIGRLPHQKSWPPGFGHAPDQAAATIVSSLLIALMCREEQGIADQHSTTQATLVSLALQCTRIRTVVGRIGKAAKRLIVRSKGVRNTSIDKKGARSRSTCFLRDCSSCRMTVIA